MEFHVRYNSRKSRKVWIIASAVAIVAAMLIFQFWPPARTDGNFRPAGAGANSPGPLGAIVDTGSGGAVRQADSNTPAGRGATSAPADANAEITLLQHMPAATAVKMVADGEKLLAERKKAEGRALLSKALLSGSLVEATANTVRAKLEALADEMIFSREIFDGDPYTAQYTFLPGEVLNKVERKLGLHVPAQIMLKINRMDGGKSIRAGQTFKVIRGPFHAIVDKGDFNLDIFLHRQGSAPAFIKRLRVGLGKNSSTPTGLWRVRLGSKRDQAPWFPPPNAEAQRSIRWGEPGYPLGKMGYWIGMEGLDDATRTHEGYGIHGTNDLASIGKAASLGCIRLADADIELVFSLLYEKWSTIRVRP